MKIGEIAKAAGVTTSRIRFYEKRGIVPKAARGANGYRDYPADLVALLRFVEQAQGLGFSLREITQVKIGAGEHLVSCEDALALLAGKLDAVTALIAEAQERKRRIETLIGELRQSQASGSKPDVRQAGARRAQGAKDRRPALARAG